MDGFIWGCGQATALTWGVGCVGQEAAVAGEVGFPFAPDALVVLLRAVCPLCVRAVPMHCRRCGVRRCAFMLYTP